MRSLDAPTSFLTDLASQSGAAWSALGAQMFPGELSVATDDGVYRFMNGVFLGRARKLARTFECPKTMRGMRLIGFLHDEGGLWSLSPRFRAGARAVLWKPDGAEAETFILTSAAVEVTMDEVAPRKRSPSGVVIRRIARPPSIREPAPRRWY